MTVKGEKLDGIDVTSLTTATVLFSLALISGNELLFIAALFAVSVGFTMFGRAPISIVLIGLIVPALPISFSHFIVEPIASGSWPSKADIPDALLAYFRVAGLVLFSIYWLTHLTFRRSATLSRLLPFGSSVVLLASLVVSSIEAARARWVTMHMIHSLRAPGSLRSRRRIKLRQAGLWGLQLSLASLIGSRDLALSAEGRGLSARMRLRSEGQKVTLVGIFVVLISLAAFSVSMNWLSLENFQ